MTDNTHMVPTDDEIDAVVQACRERGLREFDVFRAVLAKWGSQPVACEPLIRQLVAALEGYRRNHNDTQPCDAERAGRAWLESKK